MIVEMDFMRHWKTKLLQGLLNDRCAHMYLLNLWAHCQFRKTHRFPLFSKQWLGAVCNLDLDAGYTSEQFHDAMVESGFVDIEGDELVVHDWDKTNASLIAAWENGKKGGRPSAKKKPPPPKKDPPEETPEETHGLPMGNPSVTDG